FPERHFASPRRGDSPRFGTTIRKKTERSIFRFAPFCRPLTVDCGLLTFLSSMSPKTRALRATVPSPPFPPEGAVVPSLPVPLEGAVVPSLPVPLEGAVVPSLPVPPEGETVPSPPRPPEGEKLVYFEV